MSGGAGGSDRSADFRALARFFAEAPDDPAAHRLWRAAFAFAPARHLSVDRNTERPGEAACRARRGRGRAAADQPSAARDRLVRAARPPERRDRYARPRSAGGEAEREAAEIAAARWSLATDGPAPLSGRADWTRKLSGCFWRPRGRFRGTVPGETDC